MKKIISVLLFCFCLLGITGCSDAKVEKQDRQLVRDLNLALVNDEQTLAAGRKHANMTEALKAAKDAGFDVCKINATKVEYEILWDSVNDVFCYINDTEIEYLTEFPQSNPTEAYQYWKTMSVNDTNLKSIPYSVYASTNSTVTSVITDKGFDSGEYYGIETVEYTSKSGVKDVIIRTNSHKTTLNISASTDSIKHYGKVGIVNIDEISLEKGYMEFGLATYVKVKNGIVTAKDNSNIEVALLANKDGSKAAILKEEKANISSGYTLSQSSHDANLARSGGIELTYEIDDLFPSQIESYVGSKIIGSENIVIKHEGDKDYIYFGKFPQTHVGDEELIEELNKITEVNELGYYEYNGREYAKIKARPYTHGYYTDLFGEKQYYKYSDGSIIENNSYEYFLVESIKWQVLKADDGEYFVVADQILDKSQYNVNYYVTTEDGETTGPNNYKNSMIREYLNNYFYNKAFNVTQHSLIKYTEVDNSAESTGYGYESNTYVCENTFDKLFLLSIKEVNTLLDNYEAKQIKLTDYAIARGVYSFAEYFQYGNWWLRSPYYGNETYAAYVYAGGYITYISVFSNSYGVRPACTIDLK